MGFRSKFYLRNSYMYIYVHTFNDSRQIDCGSKCLPSPSLYGFQILNKLIVAQFHNVLPIAVNHKPSSFFPPVPRL